MRGISVVLSVVAAGCGFDLTLTGAATPGDDQPDAGTTPQADAPIDTAPIARPLFAASDTTLYQLDVDAQTATIIGTIRDSNGTYDVDGLAFDGTNLIGLSSGSEELLIIDPNTAAVTARRTISPAGSYGGLTVAPAGEAAPTAVVFAGSGSKLVKLDPATGAATSVGAWGGTMTFFSDLAWVSGVGLHVTLSGGNCNTRCFARVDVTTGVATTFRTTVTGDVYGLSGYRGILWALHHDGPVLTVNQQTGTMLMSFDPQIAWTEAAQ